MNDLISRQAAIDIVRNRVKKYTTPCVLAVTDIQQLPSAEPKIIRCKDCEYYHPNYCEIWSRYGTIQTRETGFCYRAERKNNE